MYQNSTEVLKNPQLKVIRSILNEHVKNHRFAKTNFAKFHSLWCL